MGHEGIGRARELAGAIVAASALAVWAAEPAPPASPSRPATWAVPVALEGVPNLHKVSDGLYRSAQPTAEGMARLRGLGVRTVVNLRSFHSDRDELAGSGLGYEHIWMKAWHPEEEEVVRFLKIATDTNRIPVLVHCLHGADRTGTMCALYRVAVQGWTKEEALREMREGGFNFHGVFQNLLDWIRGLDPERIRREAGLPAEAAGGSRPKSR
jgi:protein tyrosine phosphatase (PTP) superfamily phosphohydrolase (DUF442 family)